MTWVIKTVISGKPVAAEIFAESGAITATTPGAVVNGHSALDTSTREKKLRIS